MLRSDRVINRLDTFIDDGFDFYGPFVRPAIDQLYIVLMFAIAVAVVVATSPFWIVGGCIMRRRRHKASV